MGCCPLPRIPPSLSVFAPPDEKSCITPLHFVLHSHLEYVYQRKHVHVPGVCCGSCTTRTAVARSTPFAAGRASVAPRPAAAAERSYRPVSCHSSAESWPAERGTRPNASWLRPLPQRQQPSHDNDKTHSVRKDDSEEVFIKSVVRKHFVDKSFVICFLQPQQ